MSSSVVYIQNMVCQRCIDAVTKIALNLSLRISSVNLGYVVFEESLSDFELTQFELVLGNQGFKLVKGRKHELVEAIKSHIVEYVNNEEYHDINLSKYLSLKLDYEYNYLTGIFSQLEYLTIERYYIVFKIEKVKELMFFPELSFTEIAHRLGYSSLQHLSTQFKQVTGFTPSEFRKKNVIDCRRHLDNLKII